MISLKKYGYRFLVGLLVFGLFPLSVSAQKTSGEDEIIFEITRPEPVQIEEETPEPEEPVHIQEETPEPEEPVQIEEEAPEPEEPVQIEDDTPEPEEPVQIEDDTPEPEEPAQVEDDTPEPEEPVQIEDETPDGKPLADTATSMYNYLALGALLVIVGSGLYITQRKGE